MVGGTGRSFWQEGRVDSGEGTGSHPGEERENGTGLKHQAKKDLGLQTTWVMKIRNVFEQRVAYRE